MLPLCLYLLFVNTKLEDDTRPSRNSSRVLQTALSSETFRHYDVYTETVTIACSYACARTSIVNLHSAGVSINNPMQNNIIRGPYERFVDCKQCAAVMQREAVTIMPSCGGGNVVVVVRV
jgi:hypothetical protein